MAEFIEVMEKSESICKYYEHNCPKCRLSSRNNAHNETCNDFIRQYPQEAEKLIMDWDPKHPFTTNRDKFKEVFGIEPVDCPFHASDECIDIGIDCDGCDKGNFWNEEWKAPQEKANE